jgi:hypothetical protein
MLNLSWCYDGNLFCCIGSLLVRLHWALGNKKTMKVHGQWARPSLMWRTGTPFFCLAILPFCRFLSNSLLLHWSIIPPLSCCLRDLQSKIGITNRWETTTTLRHGLHIHLVSSRPLTWTSVRIAGATFGGAKYICAFFFKLQVLEHIVFF